MTITFKVRRWRPRVRGFLIWRAKRSGVATQNQALAALLFLYKEVLAETLPWLEGLEHAKWLPRAAQQL
jgi:hypothetical protein